MFYIFLFSFYTLLFFILCLNKKVMQVRLSGWAIDDILVIFVPLFLLLILKGTQQTNYYYALKLIESA